MGRPYARARARGGIAGGGGAGVGVPELFVSPNCFWGDRPVGRAVRSDVGERGDRGFGVIACRGGGAVPAGRPGGVIAVSGGGDPVGGSCRGVVRGIGRKKMPGGAGHFGVGLGRSFLGALFAGCVLFPRRDRRRAWRRRLPWHPLRAFRRLPPRCRRPRRHPRPRCRPCRWLRCP